MVLITIILLGTKPFLKLTYRETLMKMRSLSVFSAPANYGAVKIARSSFDVVLQTMKHTMIYPSSGPSSEVIALRLVV
jgi:hypothetical protein